MMNTVKHRKTHRLPVLLVVILLFLVLLGKIVWGYWILPRLRIQKITLESDLAISDEQLFLMLEGESWASLDEKKLQERIESYPVVRQARVSKVFPDTLRLSIHRRQALAAILADDESGQVLALFDREGYAVQLGAKQGTPDLPILSGANILAPQLGDRLPDFFQEVLSGLFNLRDQDPQLFALISELEFLPREEGGYDFRLYMNHIPIPILIDHGIDVESMRRAILVLDILSAEKMGTVLEADIRGGQVVYRRAEES